MRAEIAIIGGSGIYDVEMFSAREELKIDTPFGVAEVVVGEYAGRKIAFISRHGAGHRISPTEINARANIFALKKLGVSRIIAASAVGSLKEEIRPLDLVVPNQIFDRTKSRKNTFFEGGIVVHVGFADPFCPELSTILADVIEQLGRRVHRGGTYVCIEGPQFSTRAESEFYRRMGFDIIGMTAIPEAKLAREAEICYAMVAAVTDYDVWRSGEEEVSAELILENLRKNEQAVKAVLREAIPRIPTERKCECGEALKDAIVTAREHIPPDVLERLKPLVEKYLK
ncbi:MAG: Purine nucleoside phosphorylase [Candidatus Alkanophagales archaeon MCA70_species_1]|nr:Purine nucleoside phosphorylase [Candidatus Alkanophaga volatiphilum]